MDNPVLIYFEQSPERKRLRPILEKSLPQYRLSFSDSFEETDSKLKFYGEATRFLVLCLPGKNLNDEERITTLAHHAKSYGLPVVVIFDEETDLTVFDKKYIDALISANTDESVLRSILLSLADREIAEPDLKKYTSKNDLEALLESTSVGIYCYRGSVPIPVNLPENELLNVFFDAICVECNSTYAKMGGLSREQVIGKRVRDILPLDKKENIEYLQQFIRNGFKLIDGISHKTTPLGESRYFSNSLIAHIKEGTIQEVWGTQIDITRKVLSDIRLEIMQKIGEAANRTIDLKGLIALIERELGKVINTRNFLVALYDRKKNAFSFPYMKDEKDTFDEIPARGTISALVVKEKKTLLLKQEDIKKLERAGTISTIGTPAKCWLGIPLIVNDEVMGVMVLQDYEDENSLRYEDKDLMEFISTQVGAAIYKKQADDEIRSLYHSIQQSPVSVIITDTDGKIIYCNRKFVQVTGYSYEDIIGNTPRIIKSGLTSIEIYEKLWSTITSGKAWRGELLNKKKNGELYWESASISPVKNKDGVITHFVAVKEDITERKNLEEDLLKAKKKAEESDQLKTAFLANMSHEIRTPMNAIIGFTEILNEKIYSEEEQQRLHQLIMDNGHKLLGIIDDIVDIAKIEAGQLSVKAERCSANKILYDNYYNFKELRKKLGKKHIHIIARQFVENKNFVFISDGQRINQVISNLMNNALKYTFDGTIELGYTLRYINNKDHIDFYVKDTGIGIRKENFNKIFDRFSRFNVTGDFSKTGGTGLGLAISKNLAKLLGGDILVESVEHQGSSFHLILPFKEIIDDRFEPEVAETPVQKNTWANKTILIAEDEDSNFHLLEIMLKKTKAKIIRAFNGKEAVDFIRGGKTVDFILMDVRMPLMDGYEATRLIKKFDPDIPVVAQTAYALSGDRENSLEAGCDDYISKPIRKAELFGVLSKFLG
jgi:PAS domain S-box-containing protein